LLIHQCTPGSRWRSSRYCSGAKGWRNVKATLQQIKISMSKTTNKIKKNGIQREINKT
jgi:hypothetical protein